MIPNWLTSPEWANLVKALLHTLWQGTIIAVLLAVALHRQTNPMVRYRRALLALSGVLLSGLVTWGILSRPLPQEKASAAVPTAPAVTTPAAATIVQSDLPPVVVVASPVHLRPVENPWTAWLALLWLIGAAAMTGRAAWQVAGAEKLRRSSRPLTDSTINALLAEARRAVGLTRRIRLAVTESLSSPVVAGVLMPTLILPLSLTTTLAPEQIRFILLHELAHIRRGDYFANLFQLFMEALLFFNPAVWWISHQLRLEREACCDALAVELSGAPADYARTLLHVVENVLSPTPAAAPAFGGERKPSSLADRIQRMLVPGYRPALRLTWRAMCTALLTGSALLFLSAIGTRVTIAAILSPQQRIERIEKKMAEYGQSTKAVDYGNDAQAPQVAIKGHIRMADGSAVPHWITMNVYSSDPHGSYGSAIQAHDGNFAASIRAGTIYIGAETANFAPVVIGPLDGFASNKFDNLELTFNPGFDVPVQVLDADSGTALTKGTIATMFWMSNFGFQSHSLKPGPDGFMTLTHCADLPIDFTVNVPGYEIAQKHFDHVREGQPLRVALRRGEAASGAVLDLTTGQPIADAEFHLLYQAGAESPGRFNWDDTLHSLGRSDTAGSFKLDQLRPGIRYYIGASAPGHGSVILKHVSTGTSGLTVRLGPELIVHGHITGDLEKILKAKDNRELYIYSSELYENNSYGDFQRVPLQTAHGATTFQFTNRTAGHVRLNIGSFNQEFDITAPIDDLAVNLTPSQKIEPKTVPMREVVFRFVHPSKVPPRGTVNIMMPATDDARSLREQEIEITNDEVHVEMPIGSQTSISPAHTIGYWFEGTMALITIAAGEGPRVIEIPAIPAGAIYAKARNDDGTPAGGLIFGVTELKRAPSRAASSPLEMGSSDGFSDNNPRNWVSGPLPLGGTYQIYGWRGTAFCVSQPIKLTDDNPDAEVELKFAPGKILSGLLLDPDGQPVRDAELKTSFALSNGHGFGMKPVFTDAQGRFQLENTTPDLGAYSIELNAPGCMAETVKLKATSQPQTIHVKRGRILAGRVVEAGTGYAIPNTEVRVWTMESSLPQQTTHTDADGHFEFNTLGDAEYTLFVEDGQNLSDKKYRADGTTNLTVQLKLYSWSKVKPQAAANRGGAAVGVVNAFAGGLTDPNFRVALRALSMRTGVEALGEPEPTTIDILRKENLGEMYPPRKVIVPLNKSPATNDTTATYSPLPRVIPNGTASPSTIQLKTVPHTNAPTGTGNGRQAIIAKLDHIRLDHVSYDNLPLREVLKQLAEQCKLRDPERKGINFLIDTNSALYDTPTDAAIGGASTVRMIDPNTGVPVSPIAAESTGNVETEPVDVGSYIINMPSLKDVRLADLLDAFNLVSDHPLRYSIEDFAVVFSAKQLPTSQLVMRTFRVDPNIFYSRLENATAQSSGSGHNSDSNSVVGGFDRNAGGLAIIASQSPRLPSQLAIQFFESLGVNLSVPGKAVFFNDRLGYLFVKATESDLGIIEKALQMTNQPPRQVHIKARFIDADNNALEGIDGLSNSSAPFRRVLTDPNFRVALRSLSSRKGVETLGEPEITVPNGRQTQMRATTIQDVIMSLTDEGAGIGGIRQQEREMMERAIHEPNETGPQIHIKARFLEVPKGTLENFNKTLNSISPAPVTLTGILSSKNANLALQALLTSSHVKTLGEPDITIYSGRHFNMLAGSTIPVFTNFLFNPDSRTNTVTPQITQFATGSVLDAVPFALSDGYTISLAADESETTWLGYADAEKLPPTYVTNSLGAVLSPPIVLPVAERRHRTAIANLYDGQTLVLTLGPEQAEPVRFSAPDKNRDAIVAKFIQETHKKNKETDVVAFITPTLVDAADRRIHSDTDLIALPTLPPQPQQSQQ